MEGGEAVANDVDMMFVDDLQIDEGFPIDIPTFHALERDSMVGSSISVCSRVPSLAVCESVVIWIDGQVGRQMLCRLL